MHTVYKIRKAATDVFDAATAETTAGYEILYSTQTGTPAEETYVLSGTWTKKTAEKIARDLNSNVKGANK